MNLGPRFTLRRAVGHGAWELENFGNPPPVVLALDFDRALVEFENVLGLDPHFAFAHYARAVEAAGAFSVVLESIPRELAAEITRGLRIPTIGIGAGPECDGQVLVTHDLLGFTAGHTPKFARRYANLSETVAQAAKGFCEDVREGRFPSDAESFHLSTEARDLLKTRPQRRSPVM